MAVHSQLLPGCVHGCTYCFARQYHEFLGYGAGTDFETKIVVKPNAPRLLREELKKTRDKMPHIDFSFATDPHIARSGISIDQMS